MKDMDLIPMAIFMLHRLKQLGDYLNKITDNLSRFNLNFKLYSTKASNTYLYRIGNIVVVTSDAFELTKALTIPYGFRPKKDLQAGVATDTKTISGIISVKSNGSISPFPSNNISNTTKIIFNCVQITVDDYPS